MNKANPRSVADHKRFHESIETEYAKQRFWKIQNSLGHYFWSMAQEALEENLKCGGNKRGRFAAIAAARKAKMQKEWKTQLERRRELQNFARSIAKASFNETSTKLGSAAERRQKYLALKKAFNPVVRINSFSAHPLRAAERKGGGFELFVFPCPLPRKRSLIARSAT